MKIAIDISSVVYGTGVSWYTQNLVKNILRLDREDDFTLFGGSLRQLGHLKKIAAGFPRLPRTKFFPLPPTALDFLWNRLHSLPIEKLIGDMDVFHSSDWTQPPSSAFKVTTIHDLVPLKFPRLTDQKIISVHKARLKWGIKEVDRVIVPSRVTAEDVQKLGISSDKIRIIPEATNSNFKPAKKYQIEKLKK